MAHHDDVGLDKKTELTQGRWFADSVGDDDTVEAVMMEEAMYRSDIHIGDVFEYPVYGGLNITLTRQDRRRIQAAQAIPILIGIRGLKGL